MCNVCLTRRGFFSVASMAALAIPAVAHADTKAHGITPDEALARLKEGNKRYVSAPELCERSMSERRAAVANSQQPYAVILTCADSRVAPELVFGGTGLGDLFVCRNAGNVADVSALGSIEYAIEHLKSPLIVVMGHERCGAVGAAVDVVTKNAEMPGFIKPMIDAIVPNVIAVKTQAGDLTDNAVKHNAHVNALKISTESKIVEEHVKAGKVRVVHGRYDLDTGAVTLHSI